MWNQFTEIITNPWILYGGSIFILLLVILFIVRFNQVRKLRSSLLECHRNYNELKTSNLTFNIKKARALSQMSSEIRDIVNQANEGYDIVHQDLKELSDLIIENEDYLELGKLRKVREALPIMQELCANTLFNIKEINDTLAVVLEQESQLRLRINKLKDVYRDVKQVVRSDVNKLASCLDTIDTQTKLIEGQFEEFENSMSVSQFMRASELVDSIAKEIKNIKDVISRTPEFLDNAKIGIPSQIRLVEELYKKAVNEDCKLAGLQIESTIGNIKMLLQDDLNQIKNANVVGIDEHFVDYSKQLNVLSDLIKKEYHATLETRKSFGSMHQLLKDAEMAIATNQLLSERVANRYGQDNFFAELGQEQSNLILYKKMLQNLEKESTYEQALASSILLRMRELELTFQQYLKGILRISGQLSDVCKDEEHAKEQLLKLNIVINEVLVLIRKNKLPSISETFNEDLSQARGKIANIEDIFKQENINVEQLSLVLNDTVDFVYKFYNDVNFIVGTSKIVENTILFCNRFRSSFPDIDSDLAKAEICFQNGEYSNAISLAVPIAQKMFPDNYADLIKEYNNQ